MPPVSFLMIEVRSPIIRIGIAKHKYIYTRQDHAGTQVWVCARGSDYSKADEKLVLVEDGGYIIAEDCANGDPIYPRQRVFRAKLSKGDPTKEGSHEWEQNWNADATVPDMTAPEDWHEPGNFQTTVL